MTDQSEDEIEDMPRPPAVRASLSPEMRASLQRRSEEMEFWQTHVLRQRSARVLARASDLYRRVIPGGREEVGRARRILSPLAAKCEQHLYDEGSVAHIVTLGDPLVRPGADVRAWCGAHLAGRQKWGGLGAFSTCPSCRSIAGDAIYNDERGKIHRLAETDVYRARLQIDPTMQMEVTNAYLEQLRQNEETRRRNREQHARLARRAARLDRRIVRGFRALGEALSLR